MKINLIEYLEETIKKFPKKTAVIDKERTILFDNLVFKSKVVAQLIIQKQKINTPIAVFLDKSIESVYSDLGIIYSGNFYMNLDIKAPAERLKNIIQRVEPSMLITSRKLLPIIEQVLSNQYVIIVDEVDYETIINEIAIKNVLSEIIDTDPLCIINTSGSTGTPKGVVLNHRSFIDFTERSIESYSFSDNEIMGSLSPLVFDIYSFELCMLMAKATTIVLIPDNYAAFPVKILNVLKEENITFLFWVPTIMVNIANMDLLASFEFPSLKNIWFAGEVFPTKPFNYWRKHLPNVLFSNLYGPIEITLDCVYYKIEREIKDDEPIPIGFKYKNTDVLILDADNKLVKDPNIDGELCVRGTSLAMGYYNNSERTAQAFVQNPLNKAYPEIIYRTGDVVYYNEQREIIFKGRKDSLIKHLGYRIELGEIEHVVVNTLKLVKNCCVVYNYTKKEIVMFYEAIQEIDVSEFRKNIGMSLPKYMVPTAYFFKTELPRNTNGKIDRLALSKVINGN